MIKFIIIIIILIIFLLRKYIKIVYNLKSNYLFIPEKNDIIFQSILKKNMFYSYYECILIMPQNFITLIITKNIYESVKHILIKSPDEYVTFTRLNLSYNIRLYCDWCSIINGFCKLYIDSVNYHLKNNNFNLINNINQIYTKIAKKYIEYTLIFRDNKITDKDINLFIKENFIKYPDNIHDLIYNISYISLGLEQIELRWCPFKSMQNYFRNTNPSFVPINKHIIYKVGEILSKYDTIECIFCNKVIHEEIDPIYISNNFDTSPMLEFYKFLKS